MLILILFLTISILNIMANRKDILDQNKGKLLDSVNAANQVYTNEELSVLVDELREKQDKLLSEIYPVGSIYKSIMNKDPGELFGGTWELLNADYDYISVGSQVIFDYQSNTQATQSNLILSYDRSLFNMFQNITTPKGYEPCVRFSFQLASNAPYILKLKANDQVVVQKDSPWSNNLAFRILATSNFIRLNDLPLQNNLYNNRAGIKLYADSSEKASGDNIPNWTISNVANFYNVMLHGFFCSKEKVYTYKRNL